MISLSKKMLLTLTIFSAIASNAGAMNSSGKEEMKVPQIPSTRISELCYTIDNELKSGKTIDQVARLIQNKRINVNLQATDNGYTVLHYAVELAKLDVVKVLLAAGARTHIFNIENKNPYDMADYSQVKKGVFAERNLTVAVNEEGNEVWRSSNGRKIPKSDIERHLKNAENACEIYRLINEKFGPQVKPLILNIISNNVMPNPILNNILRALNKALRTLNVHAQNPTKTQILNIISNKFIPNPILNDILKILKKYRYI